MGADLYIKNLPRDKQMCGFDVSDKARANGYFRDCYNDGGLFAVMNSNVGSDLSWWQTADRKDLFVKDEECGQLMTVEGAKLWLCELIPTVDKFTKLDTLYYSNYNLEKHSHEKGKRITKSEAKVYHKWAKGLMAFLELAIKLDSQIIWSV
jgi:hypothetical protein